MRWAVKIPKPCTHWPWNWEPTTLVKIKQFQTMNEWMKNSKSNKNHHGQPHSSKNCGWIIMTGSALAQSWPVLQLQHHDCTLTIWPCRWRLWRVTWERQGRSMLWKWSVCRPHSTNWRKTCPSFGWTCSATRPITSSCCASNRTLSWRSRPTGGCWRERTRECLSFSYFLFSALGL